MIKVSQLVDSQLSDFFRQEYPTFVKFFEEYYKATEIDGASTGLLRQIQKYQNADFYKDGIILETTLAFDITADDTTIGLSQKTDNKQRAIWKRFPSEGLVLLNDGTNQEIIQYKNIDPSTGVLYDIRRGSSGTTKLGDLLNDSTFISTNGTAFSASNTTVTNISHLFLATLFKNLKSQYFSGIPIERLNEDISVPTILKYIKDFYASKGTSPAIEFLFRSAFNDEKILVRYPNEQLLKSSVSTWSVDTILQGTLIKFADGVTVDDLPGLVLKQITYGYDQTIGEATASIEKVIPIKSGNDTLYRIFLNAESVIGHFQPANETRSNTTFGINNKTLVVDSTIGFPEINGEFYVEGINDVNDIPISFSYAEKTATEFYDVSTNAVSFPGVGKNLSVFGSNILYVVSDSQANPLTDYYSASFRPAGLISETPITGKGLFVKEGDVVEFGLSGKKQDAPINSSWRQNVPSTEDNIRTVSTSGNMVATYLSNEYNVSRGVNQVFENNDHVFVSSNGFPDVLSIGEIKAGPHAGLSPASQRHLKKIPKVPSLGKTKTTQPDNGTIGVTIDGVPIISFRGVNTELDGPNISGQGGQLTSAGELSSITVVDGGSGYTAPPKVVVDDSVGTGAFATAQISGGKVIGITLTAFGAYQSTPEVTISAGSGAQMIPQFPSNNITGEIETLNITQSGQDYTQVPEIVIVDESGRGRGARFVVSTIDPTSGAISSIRKVSGGYDYDTVKTKIYIVPTASGANVSANVTEWHRDNIKEYQRYSDKHNGYPFPGLIPEYHDAYNYVGNPVGIRNILGDNIVSGNETAGNLQHSPIIGWAYDGVPIYGPVGYTNPLDTSSPLKRLESSYFVKDARNAIGVTAYSMGTFIEDYEYKPDGDALHKDLDEFNGRICITPEFPLGRYCYFTTVHSSADENQIDRYDIKPRFPYVVGPTFKYAPESSNWDATSILKNLPTDVIRVRDENNNLPQFGSLVGATVSNVSSGSIDSVIIENGGKNYVDVASNESFTPRWGAGDEFYVDNSNTQGTGFTAAVSSILPKSPSGDVVNTTSIVASDIVGKIDSRQQKLTVPSPSVDTSTNVLYYNRISEGDEISDNTVIEQEFETAIDIGLLDKIYLRANNLENLSTGMTLEIEDEIVYVNGVPTNNTKYVYLKVSSTEQLSNDLPITAGSQKGFYYEYINGAYGFDEIYVDANNVSYKIGKIIALDRVANTMQLEMYINPVTSNYYTFTVSSTFNQSLYNGAGGYEHNISVADVGGAGVAASAAIFNADGSGSRYASSISSPTTETNLWGGANNKNYFGEGRAGDFEFAKSVPVLRGWDASKKVPHLAGTAVVSQTPEGVISDYTVRISITGASSMDAWNVGTYIKGATSQCEGRVSKIEKIDNSNGYLFIKDIKSGPNASDLPRFGAYSAGTFSSETVNEIGIGATNTVSGGVVTSYDPATSTSTQLTRTISNTDTIIRVGNAAAFPLDRYISIGSEKMRIVSRDIENKTWTVARKQLGSSYPTSGSHLNGATVEIANAQATFTAGSDKYYATVDLYNAQRFTTSSSFKDQDDNNIFVQDQVINPITTDQRNIAFGPTKFDFFNLGNIVKIGTEMIRLDGKAGNIFQVTRGLLGTTGQEHAHNTDITNQSELEAMLQTDIAHGLSEDDLVEIFGDPATNQSITTPVVVKFDGTNNRFLFSSIHTNNSFESNPNLSFVYGHKYVFDVSELTNQTTILSFYNDDLYTDEYAVSRVGTPGNANATVTLIITDTSISNLFYDNSNSSITDSNPKINFVEDPYNTGGTPIFDVTSTTFKYIVKRRVEGQARGTKKMGVVTPNVFGEIANINIINQGFGYESLPVIKGISLRKDDELRYSLTIDENTGEITGVSVSTPDTREFGGSRYISPTIYVIGSGTGAELVADTQGGSVRSIRVTSGGQGYTSGTELLLVEEDERNIRVLPSSSTIGKVIGLDITSPGARFSNNYTMVPETTIPVSMQLVDLEDPKKYEFGERVYQGDVNNPLVTGIVVDYNEINQTLRVRSVVGEFLTGQVLKGYLSGTESKPKTVNSASIQSTIDAITTISGFFSDDLGKLSTSSQKIQDSYFYQDFSYVIRSQIPVTDWREIIKDSTHPAGFLVFGEVILDSSASVSTVPIGGATTCPSDRHKFTFDTSADIQSDFLSSITWATNIFLRNGSNIKVGDSFKYYQDSFDYELKWKGITAAGDIVEGKMVDQKIYYVTYAENDGLGNAYIKISDYHPNDTFADAEHNRERFDLSLQSTSPNSYLPNFTCDAQNPNKQITIEVFKEFIDIDPTIPMELTDSLKTVQINKFFRMVERPGMGSLISAEGTVAIDLSYVDDITANIDGIKRIYDIREEGSLISPYNDNSLLVTIDGVGQEPGKAYTIINDRKIQSLEITTTGAGSLEYDSWKITSGTTDIDNGATVVGGTADITQVYKDEEFIYITSRGIPSYTSTIGPYSGLNPSFQDYIKRVPTEVFAPVDKQNTPLGVIGMFANGTLLQNSTLETTYNNNGTWTITEVGSKPLTDEFGGKANTRGQYYQACNPIGLRRQLNDNMTSTGDYAEDASSPSHSPILGWAFDGTPIYGPYGYTDAHSATSAIKKIQSGYSTRPLSTRNTLIDGTILTGDQIGPPVDSVEFNVVGFVPFSGATDIFIPGAVVTQVNSATDDSIVSGVNGVVQSFNPLTGTLLLASVNGTLSQNMWIKSATAWCQISIVPTIYNIGYFVEDYSYSTTGADLDVYNGRFCVTPEFPLGRYCYFTTIKNSTYNYTSPATNTAELNAAYPFVVGPQLYHTFYPENQLTKGELSSKIIFAAPPTEFIDPDTGHTQTQKFVGRKFGFSDVVNNKNFAKKFVDISPQFDGYKTTFALQTTAQQPSYAPQDPLEPAENALVFMDGIIQIPGPDKSYTIDNNANTITFSTAPKRVGKVINMSEVAGVLNFRDNEIIVGATSGATGKVVGRTPLGYEGKGVLKVEVLTKDFIDGENITAPAVSGDVEPRTGKDSNGDVIQLGNLNVSAATYNPNDGELVLTVSDVNHLVENADGILVNTPITTNDELNIRYKSINFTCFYDNHATEHRYPRGGDPAHRQNLPILAVGSQTITVNVGISSNTTTHLFVNASNPAVLVNGKTFGRGAINTPIKLKGTVTAGDRFLDAANLLEANKSLIAEEAVLSMLDYPAYKGTFQINSGSGNFTNQDCIDDVTDVISAIVDNIRFGGNDQVHDAANLYVNGGALQHLVGEEEPSKLAFRWAKDLCVLAMQNKLDDYNKLGTSTGYSTYDNASTNKMIDGANLLEMNKDLIAYEAVSRMTAQYPSYTYPTGFTSADCIDDVKDALDSIIFNMTYGGNSRTWDAASFYAKGISNYVTGRETEIVYTFNAAKDIASEVCRNILVNIQGSHGYTQHTNATITDSTISSFTPTGATYNPTSGEMVLTIPNHGLTAANSIEIDTDSLEFTCTMDSNDTKHTYPRSSDPANSKALEILNTTTNTISVNVGSSPLENYDITAADYNQNTGDMEITIGNHNFIEGSGIKLAANSLTFTCLKDFNTTNHTYPRTTDPVYNKSIPIKSVGISPYTIAGADYNPETGTAVLNIPNHPFTAPTRHTADSATYNPLTGELKVTMTSHNFAVSDMIRIAPNSMFFTCTMDAGSTQHSYPRETDPAANKWLPVSAVDTSTFTVNVGTSNISGYSVSDSTYNPVTGEMTLVVGGHNLDVGSSIRIAKDSLRFTCDMDQNSTYHTYPRSTDPYYNTAVKITGTTSNSITVNVGTTPTVNHNVTDATYDTTSGNMQLEIGSHTLQVGESIRLATESITFSCAFNGASGAAAEKAYPRATGANTSNGADYAYNTALEIISTTSTKITINVNGGQGAISNSDTHTFVSATAGAVISGGNYTHTYVNAANEYTPTDVVYNPTTGVMTLTVNDHKFGNGDHIRLDDDSITFTCTHGSGQKSYPRSTDPISGQWIPVSNVTDNTFDIQVLDAIPSTNTTPHTFISAETNCIERAVISTGGNYAHTFVDALAGGIEKATQLVRLQNNSLVFRCGMDNYATTHSYPRSSDPYSSRWLPVGKVLGDNFEIQIGASPNKSIHTFDSSTPNGLEIQNGKITINVGSASLVTDLHDHTFVSATTGALISGGSYTHTFSTAKNDCITARTPLPKLAPTDATYDPTTGNLVVTVKNHGLSTSDRIAIAPNSMNFTCSMDDNSSEHTYPRKSDPIASAVIPIATVNSADTFTVNVGTSPQVTHDVSNASYNHTTGDMILTIGNHTLNRGTSIKLADNSLTFTCAKDNYQTDHSYPRTDIINKDITNAFYYPDIGRLSITSPNHGFSNGDQIKIADDSIVFKCLMDGNSSDHSYPRSTDPISGKWVTVENVGSNADTFDITVGKSPLVKYTPGPATTYNPTTGLVVLSIGPHNLKVGQNIKLAGDSLKFTCAKDNHQTFHTYPRISDPAYNTSVSITAVTDTTITIQALSTIPSTNTTDHIFIDATADAVIAGGDYQHTFVNANASAISFRKDRSYDNSIEIIQDGSLHTVTGAEYNPISGIMRVTVPTHGFSTGDNVKFADGSITFTCGFDNNATDHAYPRPTDPYSNKWISITKIDDDVIEMYVGKSSNTTDHTWKSSTTDGLTRNNGQITINVGVGAVADQYPHVFQSASTGAVISGGNYTHTFVSAYSNSISVLGYDTNDCADVVSSIATLSGIITGAVSNPSSMTSIVRTPPNAYPLRHSNKTLVFDDTIAIDPASRNYTASCADVASSISTLMDIVINTIDNPASLASVVRTPKRTYIEKKGTFQEFFAYSNGKYAILDEIDITSSATTFVMMQNGSLIIPNISEQIIVTVNGVIQEFGQSYVVNESLIEFYKPIPAGADLQIIYWYGRDLEKVLKGFNVPLYEPSFIKRDSNGAPVLFTTESGIPTNKRIRTLPLQAYPIYEFFKLGDSIQIEGEVAERELVDISNRDIIEWEKKIGTNTYSLDAATGIIGSPIELRFETYNNQSTSGFISGTKVTYDNNGNSDIPGLTNGTTYYLGYTYTTRGVRLFDNYLDSIGGGSNQISISASTGVHKFVLETDLSGLKQTQFKTSDYTGEVRGREATFTARVRFTMVLSDSSAYPVGTVMFSGGQSVATVVQDLGSNKVEVQVYPDRILADGATIATTLAGANAVTMTSKENGYVYEIDSLSGSFPTGLDYDTVPILVIKAAESDNGGFARAHAEIDQNKQIARCVVDFPGENYFQVPEVLVTRSYKHITQTYPLALVRNQYNFWSSFDTTLRTTMVLDAKQLTVSFDTTITTTPLTKAGQEVTIFRTDEIVDDLSADDSAKVYDYYGSTDPAYPKESAAGMPNQVSIGSLKLSPTFQSLEDNKFNVDNTLTIGSLDDKFGSLRLKDVSDRFYSSLYEDSSVAGHQQIRFDATCHTMIREFAGKFSTSGSIGNSFINLEGVQGFNYMTVEGNTFWLTEDMAIYEERTFVIVGYVDRIIDSNTFIIRLNIGQNLLSGTNISNVANTVMVSIASQVSGEIETGKERLAYDSIDWVNKRLILTQPLTQNYSAGDLIRTARPIRLGST